MHLAPPLVSYLANHKDIKPEHLESVKYIVVAAAPFGEALAEKFLEKAPHVVFREGIFRFFNFQLFIIGVDMEDFREFNRVKVILLPN